jgi:hypothetical protein
MMQRRWKRKRTLVGLEWMRIMQSVIQGKGYIVLYGLLACSQWLTHVSYYRGLEEFDGNYDSDEDADFTKMDMVIIEFDAVIVIHRFI